MVQIIGVDGGNNSVKVYGAKGEFKFPSAIGEYRERKLVSNHSADDMVFELNGKKGFAGTLALYESEFSASRLGDSKAHEDMLLRTLLALHRYPTSDTDFKIVVGQPISKHTEREKSKMKSLLEGSYEFTVNDLTKSINILQVEIAAECGAAFWSSPKKGKVRILDFGSGTVNGATLIDGRYVDRDSFTLTYGLNTIISNDIASMARSVAVHALKKWDNYDEVLVAGGGANSMMSHLFEFFPSVSLLKPTVNSPGGEVQSLSPIYANAVGFYNIAKKVYANDVQVSNG